MSGSAKRSGRGGRAAGPSPGLSTLQRLDLRLGPRNSALVVVTSRSARDFEGLIDNFERTAVHSIGRARRGDRNHGPWAEAVLHLVEALPHRSDLRDLLGAIESESVEEVADTMARSGSVHPLILVIDHIPDDDAVSWQIVRALAAADHLRGVLTIVGASENSAVTRHGISSRGDLPAIIHLDLDTASATEIDSTVVPFPVARSVDEPIGASAARGLSLASEPSATMDHGRVAELVLLIAVLGRKTSTGFLARALDRPWLDVDRLLDLAESEGLVVRPTDQPATVEMGEPSLAATVIGGASIGQRQHAHRLLAAALGDSSLGGTLLEEAVEAARHAFAGQCEAPVVSRLTQEAAIRCEAAGRLLVAEDLLQQALDLGMTLHDRIAILRILGRVAGRLGHREKSLSAFAAALDLADVAGDHLNAARIVAARSLTASQLHGDGDEYRQLSVHLARLGDDRPHLSALLLARQAELVRLTDPSTSRRLVGEALEAAHRSGNASVHSRVLRTCAALSAWHPSAQDRQHVLEQLEAMPGPVSAVASFVPRVATALESGDRRDLDGLVAQYAAALRDNPMALWDADVSTLRAVQAMHDLNRHGVIEALAAMRDCSLRTGAIGGYWAYPIVLSWALATGQALVDLLDPRIPVPTMGGVSDLFQFAGLIVDAEMGEPNAVETIAFALPDPQRVPEAEWTTPTWWPLLARAAWHLNDRRLAQIALDRLDGQSHNWVLVGSMVPIGPTAWFMAETQHMLGRTSAAMSTAEEAMAAAERMRSVHWMARCNLQRAQLAHLHGDDARARALLEEAKQSADHYGLQPVSAQVAAMGHILSSNLSGPETEVLDLIARGFANKQIASHLSVSVKRVERLLSSAYRTLGVRGRAEAVAAMLNRGSGSAAASVASSPDPSASE